MDPVIPPTPEVVPSSPRMQRAAREDSKEKPKERRQSSLEMEKKKQRQSISSASKPKVRSSSAESKKALFADPGSVSSSAPSLSTVAETSDEEEEEPMREEYFAFGPRSKLERTGDPIVEEYPFKSPLHPPSNSS